jgi:flavorubredoxin
MKTKAVLVYLTTGGNTRRAAEYLASQISVWAEVEALPINEAETNPRVLADASIVGVGGPVFHLRLAKRAMRLIQAQVSSTPKRTRSFFIFCSYAGISSGLALLSPATILKRAGYPILGALKLKAPHFYQSDVVFPDREARAEGVDEGA